MPKFIVEIQEIVRYAIEVEAKSAKKAVQKAEKQFFDATPEERSENWNYEVDIEFGDGDLVD